MYAEYFNLKSMPFQLTPDSQFFFESREHHRAVSHLMYGLAQEEGFVVITGEIGAGKTMLVEHLWSQLDHERFVAVRILTTHISGDDMLKIVADGFGLRREGDDKATLLLCLERHFTEQQAGGRRCLLVIDEVQNLPLRSLEELRMLSNVTVSGRSPFQCLLLGQPQFRQSLANPELEQLRQRILASYHLGPLSDAETRKYIEHRLTRSGWIGDPSFEDAAFSSIFQHSGGIPRKINTLCSRLLLAAYLDEMHQIGVRMVENAAEEWRRDLSVGYATVPLQPTSNEGNGQSVEQRLASIEATAVRHDNTIKRALEIVIELIEAPEQ